MARTRGELEKLLEDFKGWHKQDFEAEQDEKVLAPLMQELLKERVRKFLNRRIGHLPDADLWAFVDLYLNPKEAPTPPKATIIEISKEAIRASKLDPEEFAKKAHGKKKP